MFFCRKQLDMDRCLKAIEHVEIGRFCSRPFRRNEKKPSIKKKGRSSFEWSPPLGHHPLPPGVGPLSGLNEPASKMRGMPPSRP